MSTNTSLPFELYNAYYDLLYSEKDYLKESEYVIEIIKGLRPEAKDLLELGCGTGNYAKYLSQFGYNVTGMEQNDHMLKIARSKSIQGFLPVLGDIVTFELDRRFSIAVSLFHVISYLNTNDDVLSCLKSVHTHLDKGGIFIFDVWYTSAVHTQKPHTRIKRIENRELSITRLAEPKIIYEENVVQVDYEMIIRTKIDNNLQSIKETHFMRHFSTPEIKLLAELAGFVLIRSEEFLTAKKPCADTWGVCYVLQKNE